MKEQSTSTHDTFFEELLALVHHDAQKPEAVVRMFLDVFDDIREQPEELAAWKENLRTAFDKFNRRLDELDVLTKAEIPDTTEVVLPELLDKVNRATGCDYLRWDSAAPATVQANESLLRFFFRKFPEMLGRLPREMTLAVRPIAKSDTIREFILEVCDTPSSAQTATVRSAQKLAEKICHKVALLHHATFKAMEEDGKCLRWRLLFPSE